MRVLILSVLVVAGISVHAQTYRGAQNANNISIVNNGMSSLANKKWFVSKYSGLSTGFSFFNGGTASFISAPVGLQLNRRLNNNLYAFAGISAAPTYINFNRSFAGYDPKNAGNGFGRYGQLGVYSRAEMGLMYINDERTFSISGSIGVQRGTYPMSPFQQIQTMQQTPLVRTDR